MGLRISLDERVSEIHVLVATTSRDLTADMISAAVARCADMRLIGERVVSVSEVEDLLTQLPPFAACALVLVGHAWDTESVQARWLARRKQLLVLRVDIPEDIVHFAARHVGMDALLAAVRELVHRTAVHSAHWRQCLRSIASMRSICYPATPAPNVPPLCGPCPCTVPKG